MKNQHNTYQQLNHMALWRRRKFFLLLVLLFSMVLLVFSLYYELVNHSGSAWVYSGSGIAICSIAGVVFLLLREIRSHKELVEDLQVQKDHYFIDTASMSEGPLNIAGKWKASSKSPAADRLSGWSIAQAKNLLRENEKQYHTLIQNLPEALYNILL